MHKVIYSFNAESFISTSSISFSKIYIYGHIYIYIFEKEIELTLIWSCLHLLGSVTFLCGMGDIYIYNKIIFKSQSQIPDPDPEYPIPIPNTRSRGGFPLSGERRRKLRGDIYAYLAVSTAVNPSPPPRIIKETDKETDNTPLVSRRTHPPLPSRHSLASAKQRDSAEWFAAIDCPRFARGSRRIEKLNDGGERRRVKM